jgi:hypothetical protein
LLQRFDRGQQRTELTRKHEVLATRDGAEAVAAMEAARGVFASEQAGDDAVFGTDASRDHAPDVVRVARPPFRPTLGVKLIGPDLLAAVAIDEPRGEHRLARRVAHDAVQFESRRVARRESGQGRPGGHYDAHDAVAAQFGGEFVAQLCRGRFFARGMNGEWVSHDRRPIFCRFHDRDARGGHFSRVHEHRRITTLGELDANGVDVSGQQVIALERAAQPARLHTHDGVDDGVEIRLAAEDFHGDRRLLEIRGAAR